MATLVHPKQITVYRYDIQSGGSESYTVPTKDRTGNLWSGGLAVGSEGTVWLAFANTVARKTTDSSIFKASSLPAPEMPKGQAAGVLGVTAIGDELWISRNGLEYLTMFSPGDGSGIAMPITTDAGASPDHYPNRLISLSDRSLLVTFGDFVDAPTSAGLVDVGTGKLRLLKGSWPGFVGALSDKSLVSVTENRAGNIKFASTKDGLLKNPESLSRLAAKADIGAGTDALAADPFNGKVWFFVVEDKTRDGSENYGYSNPKKFSAFFLRTSENGDTEERYEVPLEHKTVNPASSGGGPMESREEQRKRLARLPKEIEIVVTPDFDPMVVDKRGDLWALARGDRLVRVDAR